MKFELIEPPEDAGEHTASAPPHPAPSDEALNEHAPPVLREDPNDVLTKPVRQRMTKAVDGFRASLDQLRAHVAAKSMAEAQEQARQAALVHTEIDPEAVFRPHRFSGTEPGPGQEDAR